MSTDVVENQTEAQELADEFPPELSPAERELYTTNDGRHFDRIAYDFARMGRKG